MPETIKDLSKMEKRSLSGWDVPTTYSSYADAVKKLPQTKTDQLNTLRKNADDACVLYSPENIVKQRSLEQNAHAKLYKPAIDTQDSVIIKTAGFYYDSLQ